MDCWTPGAVQASAEESHFYTQVTNNDSTECGKVVAQRPDFHIKNLVGSYWAGYGSEKKNNWCKNY